MQKHFDRLKQQQREQRNNWQEAIALRIHRALSWLQRAEQCEDMEGQFIFLWVAFNAAYSNDLTGMGESRLFSQFLERITDLDQDKKLHSIVWQQYTGAIRVLLSNQYVYQPFWNSLNNPNNTENWQEQFTKDKNTANIALAKNNTSLVLSIIFSRLYTLRNQLVHGGATWNSKTNTEQKRDATKILAEIVPAIIEIMMQNADKHWGDACYPVVEE